MIYKHNKREATKLFAFTFTEIRQKTRGEIRGQHEDEEGKELNIQISNENKIFVYLNNQIKY